MPRKKELNKTLGVPLLTAGGWRESADGGW